MMSTYQALRGKQVTLFDEELLRRRGANRAYMMRLQSRFLLVQEFNSNIKSTVY